MYNPGDRVVLRNDPDECEDIDEVIGYKATVIIDRTEEMDYGEQSILLEFDEPMGGHEGSPDYRGKHGHCWWVTPGCIELINPIGPTKHIKDRIEHLCTNLYMKGYGT